jgi:hypothetical protein
LNELIAKLTIEKWHQPPDLNTPFVNDRDRRWGRFIRSMAHDLGRRDANRGQGPQENARLSFELVAPVDDEGICYVHK